MSAMRGALLVTLGVIALAGCSKERDSSAEPANETVMTPGGPANLVEATPAVDDGDTLVEALRVKLRETREAIGDNSKYLAAFNDLDGDGTKEGLLYLIDPSRCGTGGCSLFIFQSNGKGGWGLSDTIGPAQLPIYKLSHRTDKWADLGVSVSGGGMPSGLMAVPHGKQGYAPNPTVDPAKPTTTEGASLLIGEDETKARPVK